MNYFTNRIDEEMRPVKLKKIVKGYESNHPAYQFDMHLSYKLKAVISQYSEGKPTLVCKCVSSSSFLDFKTDCIFLFCYFSKVFCSTRKSVLATAAVLATMITFNFTEIQRAELLQLCNLVVDNKIRGNSSSRPL